MVCGYVLKRGPNPWQIDQAVLRFADVLEVLPLPSHFIPPHLAYTWLSLTLDLIFPINGALWVSRCPSCLKSFDTWGLLDFYMGCVPKHEATCDCQKDIVEVALGCWRQLLHVLQKQTRQVWVFSVPSMVAWGMSEMPDMGACSQCTKYRWQ